MAILWSSETNQIVEKREQHVSSCTAANFTKYGSTFRK